MEPRLSEESRTCHETGSTFGRNTTEPGALVETNLSPSLPQRLLPARLSNDKYRRVLSARSESESSNCSERGFRRLGRTFRSEVPTIASENHHTRPELQRGRLHID